MRILERVRDGPAGTPRCPESLRGTAQRAVSIQLVMALWILAVAVRLILINQPFVDHWSWRQSDVAAIFSRCDRDLAIDPDQGHKHCCRGASFLFGGSGDL